MNNILERLQACDRPDEVWAMRDELVHYIETLEAQNSALAGILEDTHGGET